MPVAETICGYLCTFCMNWFGREYITETQVVFQYPIYIRGLAGYPLSCQKPHIIGVIIANNTLSSIVIYFYLSREGIEILDNLKQLGVPLPSIMVKNIEQLNNDDEAA